MKLELIIVIVSGVITLLASFLIATYQTRLEFQKMSKQLEEKYTTALFNKRIEVYPQLFKILHDFNHKVEYRTQNKQTLLTFQQEFDGWMSTNAIFLTSTISQIAWGYHSFLIDLLEDSHNKQITEDKWVEIRNIQLTFGKFLRAELGVFDTVPAGIPELEKPHVQAILNKLSQSSKKVHSRFR